MNPKQKIQELEQLAVMYQNLIQTTRTNIHNTEFVQRAITGHEQAIEHHQNMIAQYRASITSGPDIIVDSQKKLKATRKAIVLLKHAEQIEKLKALQEEITRLSDNGST